MQVSPEEVRARAIELSREATIRRLTDPDFAASRNRMSDKAIDTNFHIVPQNQREGDYKLLHQMVQRIDPKGYEDGKYRIAIEDNEEVNASAAGRNIIVNTGLLDKLKDNPDALLGVLAHEIGHCKLEHHLRPLPSEPTASSTRAEVVDYLATQVIRNQAESQADSFAGQRLAELGVPTEPVREFLAYIEGDSVKRTAEVKDVLSRHMPRRDAQRLLDLMQNYPDLRGREGLIAPGSPSVTEPREQ
jgi:predicted Zn-dependent protease